MRKSSYILAAKVLCGALLLSSCTISMQNISTNGKADNLIDEDLTTSPDIKTDLEVPAFG